MLRILNLWIPPPSWKNPAMLLMTEGDVAVAVCTDISPELAGEGMAREIVHRLQTMRKSAGFEIADYIVTYYEGDEYTQQVMTRLC